MGCCGVGTFFHYYGGRPTIAKPWLLDCADRQVDRELANTTCNISLFLTVSWLNFPKVQSLRGYGTEHNTTQNHTEIEFFYSFTIHLYTRAAILSIYCIHSVSLSTHPPLPSRSHRRLRTCAAAFGLLSRVKTPFLFPSTRKTCWLV